MLDASGHRSRIVFSYCKEFNFVNSTCRAQFVENNLNLLCHMIPGGGPPGSYATHRNFSTDRLIPIPDDIDDEIAAAIILKGITAEYLLRRCYPVRTGEDILFHAAAGGVGLIAGQWGNHLGANMIGVAGGPDKCQLALNNGYAHCIDRKNEDIIDQVKKITGGAGVPVVYDSVGRATFQDSLDCLQPRGLLVCFGQSSGPIDPIDIAVLGAKGSLFLTRPTLFTYNATRDELIESASALIDVVSKKIVTVEVNQTFALSDVVVAHQALEGRRTTGSTVLLA